MKSSFIAFALAVTFLVGCGPREPAAPSAAPVSLSAGAAPANGTRYAIRVEADGYHPARLDVRAGEPAVLVVTRVSDEGCGQQIVFPSLNIHVDLPLNQAVEIPFTPTTGELTFTCGMNMLRGSIVAQ